MNKEDLIIMRLERMENKMDLNLIGINLCNVEIAGLKIKAGVWGAMAGMVPPLIGLIMWVMSTR